MFILTFHILWVEMIMWQRCLKKYLRNDVFEKYYQLMQSQFSRTKIVALQKLNELLRDGYVLLPSDSEKLDTYLLDLLREEGVGIEEKDAIRRCAYRLCARRHNPRIRAECLNLLSQEINPDNKMSIIPILAQTTTSSEFDKSILKLETISGLSYEQIRVARFACPGLREEQLEQKYIYSFLDMNDVTILRFLPIIFDEQPHKSNSGFDFLNAELFGELANHDDPWVQKYALGTFQKMKRFHIEDLNIDPSTFLSLDAQPKKWVMTDMFLDAKFIRKNKDLVGAVLSEQHLLEECDERVREGIAQGLLRHGYNVAFDEFVISWYSFEREQSVKVLLRSYMMLARERNKEFDYVMTEEERHRYISGEDIGLYIPSNMQKRRIHSFFNNKVNFPEYQQEKVEIVSDDAELNLILKGDRKVEIKFENTRQVNVFEGNNNQAFYTESGLLRWESIKSELEEILQKCNDDEKHELEEAMNALTQKDESKFKAALKRVVEFGSNVFSNVTANILVAYMRANGIIP